MRLRLSISIEIVSIGVDKNGELLLVIRSLVPKFMDELWISGNRLDRNSTGQTRDSSRDQTQDNSITKGQTRGNSRDQTRGNGKNTGRTRDSSIIQTQDDDINTGRTRNIKKMWQIVGENGRKCIISNTFYS